MSLCRAEVAIVAKQQVLAEWLCQPPDSVAIVAKQQVMAEWLCQPPDSIIARGRNMYNLKNMV